MKAAWYRWPRRQAAGGYIAAAFMVPILMAACSNSFSGGRMFGDYDDAVTAVATVAALVVFVRVMPNARRSTQSDFLRAAGPST